MTVLEQCLYFTVLVHVQRFYFYSVFVCTVLVLVQCLYLYSAFICTVLVLVQRL